MAFVAGALTRITPSLVLPEVVLPYTLASGAFELLAGGNPIVRLGEGDLAVYARRMDVRTRAAAGTHAYNLLPSPDITMQQMSTPTYLIRVRAEYDHHDTAHAAGWGVALPEAYRLAMRQGIFQTLRNALLYGFNPLYGEGIVNTLGAISVNLPPDKTGNVTVVTYDPGQMAIFLLTQVQQTKARTNQMGQLCRVVVCGPQRTLGVMEYQNIVALASFQAPGGGSASTGTMLKTILEKNGDTIEWVYDDTLVGKGAGGTDAIVIVVPEVQKSAREQFNTNSVADLMPGFNVSTAQFVDMVAPREIPTPLAGGAIDVLSELRTTSGWGIRPEAVTVASMQFS